MSKENPGKSELLFKTGVKTLRYRLSSDPLISLDHSPFLPTKNAFYIPFEPFAQLAGTGFFNRSLTTGETICGIP